MRLPPEYCGSNDFANPATTADVVADILQSIYHASARRRDVAAHIERLLQAGARIDAALALITLELPEWQPRRITYDGGEWHCALSRVREMPDWLDQCAEGNNADLALALLDAIVEAQRIAASFCRPGERPQSADTAYETMCCDNFC